MGRVVLGGSALVAVAMPVRANGRFPAANQLVARPGDPSSMILRATYGMLFSRDAGVTWHWVCERAIGYNGAEDPALGVFPDGRVTAGLFKGLAATTDQGCSWSFVKGGLEGQVVIDVAQWPGHPERGVALTSTYAGEIAGTPRYKNEIFLTEDSGSTWNRIGSAIDPRAISETIEVADSDPNRIYVSAIRGEDKKREGLVFVSTDGGAKFVERKVPIVLADERAPFLAAVDPKNADRIYVRTSGPEKNRLLVSDDAGKKFRAVFTGGPLLGFSLTDGGETVYVGGSKDGLHVASTKDFAFTKRNTKAIECLTSVGKTLYACSNEANGFILGRSDDQGTTFAPLLHLGSMAGPLACPAGTSMNVCATDWAQLKLEFNIEASPGKGADGGVEGGLRAEDAGGAPAPKKGARACACDVVGARSSLPPGVPWLPLASIATWTSLAASRRFRRTRMRMRSEEGTP
ncbi:MAG: hypothetical protein U0169_12695 [Polyangiaceae bacterium]